MQSYRRMRKFFLAKNFYSKKLIGKRIASKDLSELSACENKKKLKTCGKDNGLGKDDTFSGEDKNKIKLPFFMIPLKGVQVHKNFA